MHSKCIYSAFYCEDLIEHLNALENKTKMQKLILSSCILLLLLLVLNGPFLVNSECNICISNPRQACVSNTEYQQCNSSNLPYGTTFACNEGFYCSVLGGCTEDESFADCNDCGKCIGRNTFACKDTTTFELCLENGLSGITGQCTGDLKCNIGNAYICGTTNPTCPYSKDPTEPPTTTIAPTPSPETNPVGFCKAKQEEGRFPVGTNPQTTCRQYVHCLLINAEWYGPVYNCPGEQYYNSTSRICTTAIPSTCSASVTRLSFRNIRFE